MKYLLDTNIIIYYIQNKFPKIAEHFKKVPFTSIEIPTIVLAEIEYCCKKSKNNFESITFYSRFLNNFEVATFTDTAAIAYGDIRSELEKKGEPIGMNDLIIAATALAEGSVLVTHNVKEFKRVPGLIVEDWTE